MMGIEKVERGVWWRFCLDRAVVIVAGGGMTEGCSQKNGPLTSDGRLCEPTHWATSRSVQRCY